MTKTLKLKVTHSLKTDKSLSSFCQSTNDYKNEESSTNIHKDQSSSTDFHINETSHNDIYNSEACNLDLLKVCPSVHNNVLFSQFESDHNEFYQSPYST